MEKEINIKKLLNVIKRRLWIVVLLSVVCTILAGYYSYNFVTPIYQTSARLMIKADSNSVASLTAMIKEPILLEYVVNELDLKQSPESLSSQITLSTVGSSQIAILTVVGTNPYVATEIANKTGEIFIREAPKILELTDVTISILTPAEARPWPTNIDHNGMMIKGLIAGMVVGIGLVFLLDSLDDTVRNAREVEELMMLPVLGNVSKIPKKRHVKKRLKKLLRFSKVRGESVGS